MPETYWCPRGHPVQPEATTCYCPNCRIDYAFDAVSTGPPLSARLLEP
jgi:hypothetical protein